MWVHGCVVSGPLKIFSKDLTLCITNLQSLDAKKVLVSAVWYFPSIRLNTKVEWHHSLGKMVVFSGRWDALWKCGCSCLLALRLDWFINLHTHCADILHAVHPFTDEASKSSYDWPILSKVFTFPLKGMPDVFGLQLSNLQRQQLQREHTMRMLHPPAKCICHRTQGLLNFSDRLRQKKK